MLKFALVIIDRLAAELCLCPSQAANSGIRLVLVADDLILAYVDRIGYT